MYAIMGITGQVGGAAAETLLAAGLPVRAVVRSTEKARCWADRDCEVAVAEVDDPDALAVAFKGAEAVFMMLPPFSPQAGPDEIRKRIAGMAGALERSQPGRVVALSTVGAQATQTNTLNRLGWLEEALRVLPMPVALLRAAWFMENSKRDLADARAGRIHSFLQPLDRPVPMVAVSDIGAAAADLLRQDWTGTRIIELDSAEVTPAELALSFARALGSPVEVDAVPRGDWESRLRRQGFSHPDMRMCMLDGFNEGWIAFEGTHERRHGTATLDEVVDRLAGRAP